MNIEGGRQAANSQAIQNYIKGMTHAVGEAKKKELIINYLIICKVMM